MKEWNRVCRTGAGRKPAPVFLCPFLRKSVISPADAPACRIDTSQTSRCAVAKRGVSFMQDPPRLNRRLISCSPGKVYRYSHHQSPADAGRKRKPVPALSAPITTE